MVQLGGPREERGGQGGDTMGGGGALGRERGGSEGQGEGGGWLEM